jgi:hypothetical protein
MCAKLLMLAAVFSCRHPYDTLLNHELVLLLLMSHVLLQVGHASGDHPELCERCVPVVEGLGFKLPGAATKVAAAAV